MRLAKPIGECQVWYKQINTANGEKGIAFKYKGTSLYKLRTLLSRHGRSTRFYRVRHSRVNSSIKYQNIPSISG